MGDETWILLDMVATKESSYNFGVMSLKWSPRQPYERHLILLKCLVLRFNLMKQVQEDNY